jgi:hypothetical protein
MTYTITHGVDFHFEDVRDLLPDKHCWVSEAVIEVTFWGDGRVIFNCDWRDAAGGPVKFSSMWLENEFLLQLLEMTGEAAVIEAAQERGRAIRRFEKYAGKRSIQPSAN